MAKAPEEWEGRRLKHSGAQEGPIYIVIDYALRWVREASTMDHLFRNWDLDIVDVSSINGFNWNNPNEGLYPLPPTTLVKGTRPDVYLIDWTDKTQHTFNLDAPESDKLQKRYIKGSEAMDKYNFEWDHITHVPDVVIGAIENGPALPRWYQEINDQ